MSKIIKTKEKGNLIVISGPSGAGKGTVISKLKSINDNIWLSISMASRSVRTNDIPNETYFFVSREEFEQRIENGVFLEYAMYNGNYYGTPKDKIVEKLNQGFDVILEIEIQGALKVKELVPDAIFIFILPPSMSELKKRLVGRGTDSREKILDRFTTAYKEINEVTKYNYVVVNDELEEGEILIGKSKERAQILLTEATVSRIHALIIKKKEMYYLQDLNSKNGTYINGERLSIRTNYPIKAGDKICIADVAFTLA